MHRLGEGIIVEISQTMHFFTTILIIRKTTLKKIQDNKIPIDVFI